MFVFQDVLLDVFKTSWRRLEDVFARLFKTSWKTKNCYAKDLLKTSSRHVLKTSWRSLWRPTNVCWDWAKKEGKYATNFKTELIDAGERPALSFCDNSLNNEILIMVRSWLKKYPIIEDTTAFYRNLLCKGYRAKQHYIASWSL